MSEQESLVKNKKRCRNQKGVKERRKLMHISCSCVEISQLTGKSLPIKVCLFISHVATTKLAVLLCLTVGQR
jgi:hypothetical protein